MTNTAVLKAAIFPAGKIWTFYHKVRRLHAAGYVCVREQGNLYTPQVWQLTKKGFEYIESDLGDLTERRFLAHSVPHDAFVLAFHLGDFVHQVPKHVAIFTEQEFRAYDESLFPDWVPKSKSHVPDGFTCISNGKTQTVFGIEVELNLKTIDRYDAIARYYDLQDGVDHVLWMCDSENTIHRITKQFLAIQTRRYSIHNFTLLKEFCRHGWGARIIHGNLLGKSIREGLLATSPQTPSNKPETTLQLNPTNLFLSNGKSPRVLKS